MRFLRHFSPELLSISHGTRNLAITLLWAHLYVVTGGSNSIKLIRSHSHLYKLANFLADLVFLLFLLRSNTSDATAPKVAPFLLSLTFRALF